MRPYHIRWLIRRDFGFVLDIERTTRCPWGEDQLTEKLRQRNAIAFAIDDEDGDTCGHMIYELWPKRIHLCRIAVHPEFQRRGIASALVARAKEKAINNDRTMLTAEVDEDDLVSQLFLKSQGLRAMRPTKFDSVYRFRWLVQSEVAK